MKRLRRLPPTSSAASGKSSASATAIAAKRAVAGVLAGTLTLMSSLASAAPAQRVHVVQLTPAVRSQVDQAIRLTHALEAKISYVPGVQFINSKKDLLSLLYKEAKCSLRFAERALNEKPPLDAYADQLFDEPCRQKVATLLARPPAEAYVWGWLFQDPHHSNRDTVTVHLWRNGQADRSVTLPYQSSERALDVLAKRLALRRRKADGNRGRRPLY